MLKYEFIKKKIFDEINKLSENDILPSRNQLIKKYKVGEMTVRRALQELVKEQIIYSVQGKGFFVAPKQENFLEIFTLVHGINFNQTVQDTGLYPALIEELEKELSKCNFDMTLSFHKNNASKERSILDRILQKKPYGVIMNCSGFAENTVYYKKVLDNIKNIVFVDGKYADLKANYVGSERVNAYREMCSFLKNTALDKVFYIDLDYWKKTKTNTDTLEGYKTVFGNENIHLFDRPYFELIDVFSKKLREELKKYKKVGLVFVNSATANIIQYNCENELNELDYAVICCADKPNFKIKNNMHVIWLKQNIAAVVKEAVKILEENQSDIKEIYVPGEIKYINF